MDSGLDSDEGIYINGGIVFGNGNMYDEVKAESKQDFLVMEFEEKISKNDMIMIADENDDPVAAISSFSDYSIVVFSIPELKMEDYNVYKVSSVTGRLEGYYIYLDIQDYTDAKKIPYHFL